MKKHPFSLSPLCVCHLVIQAGIALLAALAVVYPERVSLYSYLCMAAIASVQTISLLLLEGLRPKR